MYSGVRKLGESQDMADDITQDVDEGSDIDFISIKYLSPDGGYPPQRISNYDEQLVQHQTLNGVGVSRMAAPFCGMPILQEWQVSMHGHELVHHVRLGVRAD